MDDDNGADDVGEPLRALFGSLEPTPEDIRRLGGRIERTIELRERSLPREWVDLLRATPMRSGLALLAAAALIGIVQPDPARGIRAVAAARNALDQPAVPERGTFATKVVEATAREPTGHATVERRAMKRSLRATRARGRSSGWAGAGSRRLHGRSTSRVEERGHRVLSPQLARRWVGSPLKSSLLVFRAGRRAPKYFGLGTSTDC